MCGVLRSGSGYWKPGCVRRYVAFGDQPLDGSRLHAGLVTRKGLEPSTARLRIWSNYQLCYRAMLEDSGVHPSNWVAPCGLIVQRQPDGQVWPLRALHLPQILLLTLGPCTGPPARTREPPRPAIGTGSLARTTGLEPATSRVTGGHSTLLSYERMLVQRRPRLPY